MNFIEKKKQEIKKTKKGCGFVFDYCNSKPCGKIDLCGDCRIIFNLKLKENKDWCEEEIKFLEKLRIKYTEMSDNILIDIDKNIEELKSFFKWMEELE